jgi:hypothetical protein
MKEYNEIFYEYIPGYWVNEFGAWKLYDREGFVMFFSVTTNLLPNCFERFIKEKQNDTEQKLYRDDEGLANEI